MVWVIPYRDVDGSTVFERIRLIHEADLDRFGGGKYRQPAGKPLELYDPFGLLASDKPLAALLLIEGEANAVAASAFLDAFPVLGLPGQAALKPDMARRLGHLPLVYVWLDRRDAGFIRNATRITERLRAAGVERVLFLEDTAGLDANETLLALGAKRAGEVVRRLIGTAQPIRAENAPDTTALISDVIAFVRRFLVLRSARRH